MALMMTSGSMPFSLASASIVCCNGFDIPLLTYPLKFNCQSRAADHRQRDAMDPPAGSFEQHRLPVEPLQPTFEVALPVDGFDDHDFCQPPCETLVVRR